MEKGPFSIPPPMQLSTCGLLSTSETNGCSSATLFLLFDKCVPKSMLCITGDLDLPHQGFSKVVCFLCSSSPHSTVFFPHVLMQWSKEIFNYLLLVQNRIEETVSQETQTPSIVDRALGTQSQNQNVICREAVYSWDSLTVQISF